MKYYEENAHKLIKMDNTNLLDDSHFLPFIDYVKSSEWYSDLVYFYNKRNKDISEYFKKLFIVREHQIGYNIIYAPQIISNYDIVEETEIYKVYKELLNKKLWETK